MIISLAEVVIRNTPSLSPDAQAGMEVVPEALRDLRAKGLGARLLISGSDQGKSRNRLC